mgnify:FL=1
MDQRDFFQAVRKWDRTGSDESAGEMMKLLVRMFRENRKVFIPVSIRKDEVYYRAVKYFGGYWVQVYLEEPDEEEVSMECGLNDFAYETAGEEGLEGLCVEAGGRVWMEWALVRLLVVS